MSETKPSYLDSTRTFEERTRDLVARLTVDEKVAQMQHDAPAIERLGVPAHNWWNECLHGVGRAGIATVFPQAIGLAATWDLDLVERVATATSDEARAKHHDAARKGDRGQYKGLTFWSPVVNLFRDPRWGRGQETYGEDPHLIGRLAVAFLRGLQGTHPRYLKLAATLKHFAAYSGPDHQRHEFDARVSERELRQTYLPHFETGVREGNATCVMTAYNRLNGEPCSSHDWLIERVLRSEWGFDGYVVSDCDAINDIFGGHETVGTPAEAAARAVRAGCDLECGCTFRHLGDAVRQGLISEKEIDRAVERLFLVRFRLGTFDPPDEVPYTQLPMSVVDCEPHRSLAREAAQRSVVLLKNEGDLLPLGHTLRRVAVIGPHADSLDVLLGNYNGMPSRYSTLLSGIREVAANTEVSYARGCDPWGDEERGILEAVALSRKSDVVVLALGMSPKLEGEQGEVAPEIGTGDRTTLDLPPGQRALFEACASAGTRIVVVLTGGGPLSGAWASRAHAILMAWYPGEEGGNAIADVLFGKHNPAGRLPVTFYRSSESLPSFEDYRMEGRTYRFLHEPCLFPFGHGLSYTRFRYSNLHVAPVRNKDSDTRVKARVDVENIGPHDGDEVVQLYITDEHASRSVPVRTLVGFQRVTVRRGQRITIHFSIRARQLAVLDENGQPFDEPGTFILAVGGGQPNADHTYESDAQGLVTTFEHQ